ncbi:MAG: NUDIX hydrolase [Acidobacteria bacterium]|nr:NUDIX hydrolase [Acidobacteriota bacterium]
MLSFEHSRGQFSCRAAGVIIDRERLLMHRDERDDFWALPGGRIEFGESASVTLARELDEELGVMAEVGRLLWVVENFFTFRGMKFHEISFYFHVSLPEDSPVRVHNEPFPGDENGLPIIFEWYPIDKLESVALHPSFLRKAVSQLPLETQYIVHRDEGKS